MAQPESAALELEDLVEEDTVENMPPPPPRKKSARVRPTREPGPAVFNLNTDQVRLLASEQPELVEKGLSIYADESGKHVGVGFPTPVGEIDLLARDRSGGFVVMMVVDASEAPRSVAEMLRRIGWVRKHVATDGKDVRGIVVIEQLPEEVAYTAAGVVGTVAFKTFRVALSFHSLKV